MLASLYYKSRPQCLRAIQPPDLPLVRHTLIAHSLSVRPSSIRLPPFYFIHQLLSTGASSLPRCLLRVDLLSILVVPDSWRRLAIAAALSRPDTAMCQSEINELDFPGEEAPLAFLGARDQRTVQSSREWRMKRSIAA